MKPFALPVIPSPKMRPSAPAFRGELQDPLGRGVGYLRISLTRGCSMRCTYCRPETDLNPSNELRLSPSEIEAIVRHLADQHGLTKVRLTGGDPTVRPDLIEIIERIAMIEGIDDLAMTTNGLTLPMMAHRYKQAGLRRINISLDTLDRERFATITGVDGLDRVVRGIDAAIDSGLYPIKINTVVVRGQNDRQLDRLVRFAADRGLVVRFIELMPMGPLKANWHDRYVPETEMRHRLSLTMGFCERLPQGHDAATRYRVTLASGQAATIGFITPMSCNFCADCNRLRLAADGSIYPCLMDRSAGSLLPALRPEFNGDLANRLLSDALACKQPEHPAFGPSVMKSIGG
ncbi:MAG: GTP 3',8-cyclase MoaA [Planctomycetota bacterium]